MEELVGRYHDAVTRYIHLKVRDKHLADEVLQEFWTKLLTGKLAGADRTKGRFRDYLIAMVRYHAWRYLRKKRPKPLSDEQAERLQAPEEPAPEDAEWLDGWRQCLLDRAWDALMRSQFPTPGA